MCYFPIGEGLGVGGEGEATLLSSSGVSAISGWLTVALVSAEVLDARKLAATLADEARGLCRCAPDVAEGKVEVGERVHRREWGCGVCGAA